jgi:hypothetical protein
VGIIKGLDVFGDGGSAVGSDVAVVVAIVVAIVGAIVVAIVGFFRFILKQGGNFLVFVGADKSNKLLYNSYELIFAVIFNLYILCIIIFMYVLFMFPVYL